MSQKSVTVLLKTQILDGGLPVQERKKALRRLPSPSRRFLESLIRDQSVPQDLQRAASSLLVKLLSTPKAKPIESSSLPVSEPPQVETPDPEAWKLDPRLAEILGPNPIPPREPVELGKPARTGIKKPEEGIYD
jgi:hypothetical protein